MVCVNKLLGCKLLSSHSVQLLLTCLLIGELIGPAVSADLDPELTTTIKHEHKRTTPANRPVTSATDGYRPEQTTIPIIGRPTQRTITTWISTSLGTPRTAISQQPVTSHQQTLPMLTSASFHSTMRPTAASHTTLGAMTGRVTTAPPNFSPEVVATSQPQFPHQSTQAPLTSLSVITQRQSTTSGGLPTRPPTQQHFTDEPHPTSQHLPPPPTDSRPTDDPHHFHTNRPPPETEEPLIPSKPHKPTYPQTITTRSGDKPPSNPTTSKGVIIPTESPTTKAKRQTTLQVTGRPSTPIPYPDATFQLHLQISWSELCPDMAVLRSSVAKFAGVVLNLSDPPEVAVLNDTMHCPLKKGTLKRETLLAEVQVDFCIVSKGTCNTVLTESVGVSMQSDITQLQTYLEPKVLSVRVYKSPRATPQPQATDKPTVGVATGLSLSFLIAVVVCTGLAYKLYKSRLAKRRALHNRYYFDGKTLHDTLNESHQLSPLHTISIIPVTIHQLVPAVNEGLVMDDEEDMAAKMYPSHVLSMLALGKFYSYIEAIMEEYETLCDFQNRALTTPQSPPKHFMSLPTHGHGHSHGNPASLFHPPPKTRITLEKVSAGNQNGFLNANLVKGYGAASYSYVATAAPWGTSLGDFWEMVWEQQSRTIVCLCSPEEMGVVCPWYWPREEGIQAAQLYGDILVMRQGVVLTENYCMSSLLVKNIQTNLCRPVSHFWFTQWPTDLVPASTTVLISFLLQIRQTVQESYGPIVTHCSDGCGRTGTLLAIDSGMRSLEDLCSVDVPSIVCSIRHDRGAAVLHRNHYAFIYKALYEYSMMLTRGMTDNIDVDVSLC